MKTAGVNRAKELFLAARELDAARWSEFLEEACPGDHALRRRVLALLRAETALADAQLAPAPLIADKPEELERYELLDVIGEGGFGTVYRARRRSGAAGGLGGDVAVKVLRAGVEGAAALARFRAEQRSLEAMDHPGIARVLDAGATRGGRPFIAMELVRGEPITTFCDRARLTIDRRVELMAEVCRAVQHAHGKGVIHRDLKPSNILAWEADGRCWAKVIDFGVAKAIAGGFADGPDTAGWTLATELVGTPAYMSPEQERGRGRDVDTRSDVYALGAVLYELLCGSAVIAPEGLAALSPGELERLICDVLPPPPSARELTSAAAAARGTDQRALRRQLRGELDWITLRALEKERSRRYATAEAMAEDLTRALRGEAVEAAPPSRVYRLSRLVRREKGLFTGLGVAMLVLVAGLVTTGTLTVRARRAEQASARARRIADGVNAFLRNDLLIAVTPTGEPGRGRDIKMREALDEASRRLRAASAPGGGFADEPLITAGVHKALADTYYALGEFPLSEEHALDALELHTRALGRASREVVESLITLARVQRVMGKFDAARTLHEEAHDIAMHEFGDRDQLTLRAEIGLASSLSWGTYDFERALPLYERVYQVRLQDLGPDHFDTVVAQGEVGRCLYLMSRYDAALSTLVDAWERKCTLQGVNHPDVLWTRFFIARTLEKKTPRDLAGAERIHLEVLAARRGVLGEEHFATLASMQDVGELYLNTGRVQEAADMLARTLELKRRILDEDHIDVIVSKSALGEALGKLGRRDEALALLKDAVTRLEQLPPEDAPDLPEARRRLEALQKS